MPACTAAVVLPALTAVTAMTTIVTCYALARSNGDLPSWLVVAQISLLGCKGSARAVFQFGFVTTALLLCACILVYLDSAVPRFEPWLRCELSAAAVLALVGAAGLALLGAVPLQEDCVACLLGEAPLRRESVVHSMGATIFFTASWLHGLLSVHAYGRSPRHRAAPNLQRARMLRIVFVAMPILAMPVTLVIASMCPQTERERMQAGAGHQWVSILSMLGMYLTYSQDMSVFRAASSTLASTSLSPQRGARSDEGNWNAEEQPPPRARAGAAGLATSSVPEEYALIGDGGQSPPPEPELKAAQSSEASAADQRSQNPRASTMLHRLGTV
jgi:hypothetical protein